MRQSLRVTRRTTGTRNRPSWTTKLDGLGIIEEPRLKYQGTVARIAGTTRIVGKRRTTRTTMETKSENRGSGYPFSALKDILEPWLRAVLHQELEEVLNGHGVNRLLSPEELAQRLNLPVSWVYEQSRQGNIPTHRLGRYIRFNLAEVLGSQKKD